MIAACTPYLLKCFNPRAREGRDYHAQRYGRHDEACFNPRAREGRDLGIFAAYMIKKVSIHAPARGATSGGKH